MTWQKLVRRSLAFYWRQNLATVAGIAVAISIITGSILIGGSVQETVRQSALKRLGKIEYALVTPHLIFQKRAADTGSSPALILNASLMGNESDYCVPNVAVIGVDAGFLRFFTQPPAIPEPGKVILNRNAARELGAKVGDDILISAPKWGAAPLESLFGRKERSDLQTTLRATVSVILDGGMGDFSLDPSTRPKRNAFVNLEWFANTLGKSGQCNVLLSSVSNPQPSFDNCVTWGDCGLIVAPGRAKQEFVHCDSMVLAPSVITRIREQQPEAERGSVFLATRFVGKPASNDPKENAYGVVGYRDNQHLGPEELDVTRWLAEDLHVNSGDSVRIEWLKPLDNGQFQKQKADLTVRKVLDDDTIEPAWTPTFEGVTNAQTISDWKPTFPFDAGKITARDEEYWKLHRAAPKAWVSSQIIHRMWRTSAITTVMLPRGSTSQMSVSDLAFASGLEFQPIRNQAIESATSSSDYAMMFIALGSFIIVSAIIFATGTLVLNVLKRSPEYGFLSACGFSDKGVEGLILAECMVLTVLGAFLGSLLGVLFTQGILTFLNHNWPSSMMTTPIGVHYSVAAFFWSALSGIGIGLIAFRISISQRRRATVLSLLSGGSQMTSQSRSRSKGALVLFVSFGSATVISLVVALVIHQSALMFFIISGVLALVTGLVGLSLALSR